MPSLISSLFRLREQLILVFMLELLHFSIWIDFAGPLSISLLLMHLGMFLIWQPLWHGDNRLKWYDVLLIALLIYAFVFWMHWWLLFAWLILLISLSGGRVLINREERNVYLLVLAFLMSELLIVCIPSLFAVSIATGVSGFFEILLPLLPPFILILSARRDESRFQSVDIMHAIFISTLATLLVAGTLLNMYYTREEYLIALVETLIIIGGFLLAVSWLLRPRAGFSGLSQLWLRSILDIGTPFENWLTELSLLFRQKTSPEEFLSSAMEELLKLSWIEGAEWSTGGDRHMIGTKAKNETGIKTDKLKVCIHSYTPVTGALYFHCKLLVQLMSIFYNARLREKELTQQTHLQAVYETGARITHDIKNLLQSLQAITSVIVHDSERDNFLVSQRLLRNQLPILTQRLKLALEKLQTPVTVNPEPVYLKDWWQDLQGRTHLQQVHYQADLSGDPIIPADMFDSVIDNLLENIRSKRQLEADIVTTISLYSDNRNIILSICDSGSSIPGDRADQILRDPLQSASGLGIGLYQAAKQAEMQGYQLALTHNLPGKVCFVLKRQNETGQIELI